MMTDVSKPEAQNMTPQAEQILEILRNDGGWLRRSDIAEIMDKSRLNKWDTALLDMLLEHGFIEAQKRPFHGGIGFAWTYRAVEQSNDG